MDLLPLLEKEAKDRQRLSDGRGKKVAKKLATFSPNGEGKSSQVAARLTKTNSAYVESVKAVKKRAPELIDKIRSGELRVPQAAEIAKLEPSERKTALRKLGSNGAGEPYVFRGGNARNPRQNTVATPPGICRFLHDLISPHYKGQTILDPCAGKGALTKPWKGVKVISYEISRGKDFFGCPDRIACDLVLCNPPFNSDDGDARFLPQLFLERILKVVPPRTPIALIAPMAMRLDQAKTWARWRWLRDKCPPITSIIALPHDIFTTVKVHSEILLFNMPTLKPHYFLPDKYLA